MRCESFHICKREMGGIIFAGPRVRGRSGLPPGGCGGIGDRSGRPGFQEEVEGEWVSGRVLGPGEKGTEQSASDGEFVYILRDTSRAAYLGTLYRVPGLAGGGVGGVCSGPGGRSTNPACGPDSGSGSLRLMLRSPIPTTYPFSLCRSDTTAVSRERSESPSLWAVGVKETAWT